MSFWSRLVVAVDRLIFGRERSDLRWWQRRARRRGVRSVYSLAHDRSVLQQVTAMQKQVLFGLLQQHLRGDERLVLDFGCGPGRFTADLAMLVGGQALGVDPIAHLLDLAPSHAAVQYRLIEHGHIPAEPHTIDVAWICLVLMTITDPAALTRAAAELKRVLRPGGLLFLVENTEPKEDQPHLRYRSVAEYQALLPWAGLQHVHDYHDAGERISVMVGRTA